MQFNEEIKNNTEINETPGFVNLKNMKISKNFKEKFGVQKMNKQLEQTKKMNQIGIMQ